MARSKISTINKNKLIQDVAAHPHDTAQQRAVRFNTTVNTIRRALYKYNIPHKTPVGRPTTLPFEGDQLPTDDNAVQFNQRLYLECRRLGICQSNLARVLDVSPTAVNAWFAGATYPKFHALAAMGELGFDLPFLLYQKRTSTCLCLLP